MVRKPARDLLFGHAERFFNGGAAVRQDFVVDCHGPVLTIPVDGRDEFRTNVEMVKRAVLP
jgi:hypothetical protein